MRLFISFICGLIMSFGLGISGMIYPDKIIGFLDVFGSFDPTLLFVMGGALLVTVIGFRFLGRFPKPFLGDSFGTCEKTKIDFQLLLGAGIFGIGWGLVGLCPGPAIVGLGLDFQQLYFFNIAMILGMLFAKLIKK